MSTLKLNPACNVTSFLAQFIRLYLDLLKVFLPNVVAAVENEDDVCVPITTFAKVRQCHTHAVSPAEHLAITAFRNCREKHGFVRNYGICSRRVNAWEGRTHENAVYVTQKQAGGLLTFH